MSNTNRVVSSLLCLSMSMLSGCNDTKAPAPAPAAAAPAATASTALMTTDSMTKYGTP